MAWGINALGRLPCCVCVGRKLLQSAQILKNEHKFIIGRRGRDPKTGRNIPPNSARRPDGWPTRLLAGCQIARKNPCRIGSPALLGNWPKSRPSPSPEQRHQPPRNWPKSRRPPSPEQRHRPSNRPRRDHRAKGFRNRRDSRPSRRSVRSELTGSSKSTSSTDAATRPAGSHVNWACRGGRCSATCGVRHARLGVAGG